MCLGLWVGLRQEQLGRLLQIGTSVTDVGRGIVLPMADLRTPKQAAIYTRVSLDHEQKKQSVTRQREMCEAEAERIGWGLVEHRYEDNSISASNFSQTERDEYSRLLRDIKAGKVDGVIAWSMDRLTRKVRELLDLIDLAREHEIPILTLQGNFDLSTTQGVAMAQMAAVFAEQEVTIKSERHKFANAQRARQGKHYGRTPPFGYMQSEVKGVIVKDPAAEPHLVKAFEKVANGASNRDVMLMWEKAGVLPKSGKKWNLSSVYKILTNPMYAGVLLHNGVEVTDDTNWEPYLSRAEHEDVVAKLASKPHGKGKRAPRRKYLLSGLLLCSCDEHRHMTGGVRGDGEPIYICSGREKGECGRTILLETAHRTVENFVLGTLSGLRPAQVLDRSILTRQEEIREKRQALNREREEIEANTKLDRRSRILFMEELIEESSALEEELRDLTKDSLLGQMVAHVLRWDELTMENLSKARKAVQKAYEDLEMDQKRLLIRSLGMYVHKPMGKGQKTELEVYPKDPLTGEISQYSDDEDPYAVPRGELNLTAFMEPVGVKPYKYKAGSSSLVGSLKNPPKDSDS